MSILVGDTFDRIIDKTQRTSYAIRSIVSSIKSMENGDRKTVAELIAQYELEPTLRDLYVEGPSDKRLFEWFLKQFGCTPSSVFEISDINVDQKSLEKFGLQSGNRDRVIALSLEFEKMLQKDAPYLLCIADSDFNFLLGCTHSSRYLLYTDYTSVDLYLWSEEVIDKLFYLGVPCKTGNSATLLTNFKDVLQELFIVRAANKKLGFGIHFTEFTRYCRINNNLVVFDCGRFAKNCLTTCGHSGDIDKFHAVCEELRAIKVATCKYRIRGHDYIKLLAWYVSRIVSSGGNVYRNPDMMRKMIILTVDAKSLENEGMFKKLIKKYG